MKEKFIFLNKIKKLKEKIQEKKSDINKIKKKMMSKNQILILPLQF